MSRFIEGQDRQQVTLLPESLDEFVAEDNAVRIVDAFVGELDLHAQGFEVRRLQRRGGRRITQRCCSRSTSMAI